MHESLKVYLKDSFVGWLSHESAGDEFSFKYDDSYLANPVDGALSFALPLGGEAFDSVRQIYRGGVKEWPQSSIST